MADDRSIARVIRVQAVSTMSGRSDRRRVMEAQEAHMRRSPLTAVMALAAVIILAGGPLEAQGVRRGANYFPNLPVVTQDGKTLKFYDDVIKGKIVLISFIYTNCPD